MKIFEFVISIICFLWILFTVFKQFRPNKINKNNDPFALIPLWTLFSPRPMKKSYNLGFRDMFENGEVSEIKIINDFSPRWYYTFWYGQRRDLKFIIGIKKQLSNYNKSPSLFVFTPGFKFIKNYVNTNFKKKNVKKRQLIYFEREGHNLFKTNKVLFVTNI